eukprot:Pgem_evm1s10030
MAAVHTRASLTKSLIAGWDEFGDDDYDFEFGVGNKSKEQSNDIDDFLNDLME